MCAGVEREKAHSRKLNERWLVTGEKERYDMLGRIVDIERSWASS